jgi:hypothetical protein
MAMNAPFDWRRSDRRLFALVAVAFPLIVLIGFSRTYYLKFAFGDPAVRSPLVHLHGLLMTAWVVFFITQVVFIRTKHARVHMRTGMIAIGLAVLMIIVGFFTAVAAAKNPSAAAPPGIPPLSFMAVPLFDMVMFAGLFAAAIYYRKRPAAHKRLMLLTVINFLPPAIARFPVDSLQALGPLFFFGVPAVLAIGLLIYDTRRNGKLSRPFLIGAIALIASYPLRLAMSGTEAWTAFATWLTTWAA